MWSMVGKPYRLLPNLQSAAGSKTPPTICASLETQQKGLALNLGSEDPAADSRLKKQPPSSIDMIVRYPRLQHHSCSQHPELVPMTFCCKLIKEHLF